MSSQYQTGEGVAPQAQNPQPMTTGQPQMRQQQPMHQHQQQPMHQQQQMRQQPMLQQQVPQQARPMMVQQVPPMVQTVQPVVMAGGMVCPRCNTISGTREETECGTATWIQCVGVWLFPFLCPLLCCLPYDHVQKCNRCGHVMAVDEARVGQCG